MRKRGEFETGEEIAGASVNDAVIKEQINNLIESMGGKGAEQVLINEIFGREYDVLPIEQDMLINFVEEAKETLTERQKNILKFKYEDGKSLKEVGLILEPNISPERVKQILYETYMQMKKFIVPRIELLLKTELDKRVSPVQRKREGEDKMDNQSKMKVFVKQCLEQVMRDKVRIDLEEHAGKPTTEVVSSRINRLIREKCDEVFEEEAIKILAGMSTVDLEMFSKLFISRDHVRSQEENNFYNRFVVCVVQAEKKASEKFKKWIMSLHKNIRRI